MSKQTKRTNSRCCNVCETEGFSEKNIDITLLKCSNCKLAFYCGRNHQTKDWKHHKMFCKSIKQILVERKIDHVLDINGAIIGAKHAAVQKVKVFIRTLMMCSLKRNLNEMETEVRPHIGGNCVFNSINCPFSLSYYSSQTLVPFAMNTITAN